jgi:hypothetical protein
MLRFFEYLLEAKKKAEEGGSKQNSAGVLHELLTGYYLNGGQHMDHYKNEEGQSPKAAHDEIKKIMNPEDYKEAHKKAKFAADDIRNRLGGKKIKHVRWTSKSGDLKAATGIDASQNEDPSDIVVTTHDKTHPTGVRHHGISLKRSDSTEDVQIANPGIEALHGAEHILQKHRDDIRKSYPQVGSQSNSRKRKDVVRANPALRDEIRERNRRTLSAMSEHLAGRLSKLSHEHLVKHLRDHVLHAHVTPMQREGHEHMRHTTWGGGDRMQAKSIDPGTHYEQILKEPQHIEARTTGQGVTFYHRGVQFARQNIKFDSQDDPLSSVKSATSDINLKKPPKTPVIKDTPAAVVAPRAKVERPSRAKAPRPPKVRKAPAPAVAAPPPMPSPKPSRSRVSRTSTSHPEHAMHNWKGAHTSPTVGGLDFRDRS